MKNILIFLKMAWKTSPAYILVVILSALISSAQIILNIILPKLLIDELIGEKAVARLILFGSAIVWNNVLVKLLQNVIKRYTDAKKKWLSDTMVWQLGEKIMNLEYSYLENPYYLDLKERAVFAIHNQNAIVGFVTTLVNALSGILTLVGLVAIMATLGPILLITIVIASMLILFCYKSSSTRIVKTMAEIIPINRRFGYYFDIALGKQVQKEIRLYEMEHMITGRILEDASATCDEFYAAYRDIGMGIGAMGAVCEFVSAFTYAYVGIRTITDFLGKKLSLGSLGMYVSSAVTFADTISTVGSEIVNLMQQASYLEPYEEFMSLEEETKSDDGVIFEGPVETVEFRKVTFTYPKAEKSVLNNISFEIKRGQKISIVGLNGAGKSTLVKLICRMYKPDSGEILINGRNILEYDYHSYMEEISAIFQDYRLFNFTIGENVSCKSVGSDVQRVGKLLEEVGIAEKIKELPHGIKSQFGKEYDEDGIELSGGQGQKIAIARALYKDASMVILDEPASALDPIAEAEIYEKFNSLVEDKTAIYISHRMSSSVFCDKILIIDGGTISDFDTHDNLMKKTDSLYYKLFMSQAENYKLDDASDTIKNASYLF